MRAMVKLTLDPCIERALLRELIENNGCSVPGPGCPITAGDNGDLPARIGEAFIPEGQKLGEVFRVKTWEWVDHTQKNEWHPDGYIWVDAELEVDVQDANLLEYLLVELGNGCNIPGLGGNVYHGDDHIADVAGVEIGAVG